jgi:tetratricopeptide (TPR) repeat protein
MKILAVTILLLLSGLMPGTSTAEVSVLGNAITPEELARLPPYCVARMKMPQDSPEARAWRSRIGENFVDFYHYCAGLNFINRYWGARNAKERGYYLQEAKTNFNYIERAQKPDFTMAAELYSNRGEVFKLMGKPGDAIGDFNRAITIGPTIVKSYLQLADLYVGSKDRVRALEVITKGLSNIPDSKALQRRYLELGGKEPFPEPVAAKAAESVPPQPVERTPPSEATIEPSPAPAVTAGPEPAATIESAPPIGTPKNPYCRFCPPE